MDMDLTVLVKEAATIAESAGREILSVYTGGFDVETKADDSPLTAADRAAHTLINRALETLTPDIPVLSEEGGLPDFEARRQWTHYWLVDPLDGTREFIKRNGEFTVNIALIVAGRPVLGVIHAPVLNRTYLGIHALDAEFLPDQVSVPYRQAERRDADGVVPLGTRRLEDRSPVLVVSRSHRHPQVERLLERLPPVETLSMGSSLKFCLVAEGSADCYPRFGPTSEWDSAAAQAIVEAAGGCVIRPDGEPLHYNTKPSILNPNFVALGDPSWGWTDYLDGLPVEER